MRVVLAAEPTGGGVARHVLDLAEGLPRRGFHVLLVHARQGMEGTFGARLERHRDFGYQVAAFDVKRAPGIDDMAATIALRREVRRFGGADILHGHSSKAGALARLARWGRARRVVYTPHAWYTQNPELKPASRSAYRLIECGLATLTDRIISVSSDEADHAVSLGIKRGKLALIHNGIESWPDEQITSRRARTRSRLGIAEDDVVIGFLGRMAPQKAPDIAVQAFRQLLSAKPHARVVVAGDGPMRPAVEALLAEYGITDRVIRLPVAHGPEVIPAFDVFLMTSRYEGFPYVLLEALSAGCAIVTTRVGGVNDCVRDGVNGLVIESLDPGAIAQRLTVLCSDPAMLARMRHESRLHAASFSLERMLDDTADLYRSLNEAR